MRNPSGTIFELFDYTRQEEEQTFPWEPPLTIMNADWDTIRQVLYGDDAHSIESGLKRHIHARCPKCGTYSGRQYVKVFIRTYSHEYIKSMVSTEDLHCSKVDFVCPNVHCYNHFSVAYSHNFFL